MIRNQLRKWLGLNDIAPDLKELFKRTREIRDELPIIRVTINRILAKTHPDALPEDHPDRRNASDLISARTMAKMMAENRVRDYYGYTPASKSDFEPRSQDEPSAKI